MSTTVRVEETVVQHGCLAPTEGTAQHSDWNRRSTHIIKNRLYIIIFCYPIHYIVNSRAR